jgi:hypothetical protein
LVEHLTFNQGVLGSIPRRLTTYRLQLHSSFQAMRTATSPMRIHQRSRRGRGEGPSVIRGMLSRSPERNRARPFRDGPFRSEVGRRSAYGTLTEVLSPLFVMVKVPEVVEA